MALIDQLVNYWKLDEASGTRADSQGSNNLTSVNSVGSATGIINLGADFNGLTQKLTGTNPVAGLGAFSVQAWLDPDSTTSGAWFDDWGGTNSILLRMSSGAFQFFTFTSGQVGGSTSLTITTGGYQHVVATYDGTTMRAYRNGTLGGTTFSQSGNIGPAGGVFALAGSATGGSALPFDGRIDEVGVWSRELSGAEVTALYNGGAGLAYPFSGGSSGSLRYAATLNGIGTGGVFPGNRLSAPLRMAA